MPQRKNVPTLKYFCLRILAEITVPVWPRLLENYTATEQVREYLNVLPIVIRYMLLDAIRLIYVHAVHFKILFCDGMNRLDLTSCRFLVDDLIFWIGSYLKNVRYLKLPTNHHLTLKGFIRLTEAIPNIEILIMPGSGCNDDALHILSLNCPRLKDLNISFCPVTNKGVRYLCADEPPRCYNLTKLCVTNTKVTQVGVIQLIINLPNLQDVEFDGCMFEVLSEIRCDRNDLAISQYNLKTLRSMLYSFSMYCRPSAVSELGLFIAVEKCPYLTELVIGAEKRITRKTIGLLCQIPRLVCLDLDFFSSHDYEYPLIMPVISYHCSTLTHLTLKGLSNGLDTANILANSNPEIVFPFPNLLFMSLTDNLWDPLDSNVFVSLLRESPVLEKLELCFSINFSDSVLEKILQFNPLKNLKEIYFQECDKLTMDAIFTLLHLDNPLEKVSISVCNHISFNNIQSAYDFIMANNLNVDVTFS